MDKHYDIWTDGSTADGAGAAMGAGWIIRDETGAEKEYASPLLTPRHGSSEIAEIMAVSCALSAIRESANITIHTDSLSVIRLFGKGSPLNTDKLSPAKKKKAEALQGLFLAAARHAVSFVKACDDVDSVLKRAHHRAREASTIASQYMQGQKLPPYSIEVVAPRP